MAVNIFPLEVFDFGVSRYSIIEGSYNVNVDIKLASLRNDYAFNDFLPDSNLIREC